MNSSETSAPETFAQSYNSLRDFMAALEQNRLLHCIAAPVSARRGTQMGGWGGLCLFAQ
ncbi:MAG: hypothetical protein ORN98_02205 [Alphaproteobacteria bacterium]|nr:hypothetical protein [Alphaproteobacteria bacterium]